MATGMLNAASTPAGTSIVPVAFWPRAAVAVPTVNVFRSCAGVETTIKQSRAAMMIRRGIVVPQLWVIYIFGQLFQRHFAIESSVLRQVNFSHAACAYRRVDFVAAQFWCRGKRAALMLDRLAAAGLELGP